MPFKIKNLKKNVVYFMIQSTIANICWDIVPLELLLGSRDQQTYPTNLKKNVFAQIP